MYVEIFLQVINFHLFLILLHVGWVITLWFTYFYCKVRKLRLSTQMTDSSLTLEIVFILFPFFLLKFNLNLKRKKCCILGLPSGVTRPSTTRGSTTLRTVPTKPTTVTPLINNNCPHGQFQCTRNSQCIPAILHCDGVPDCLDKTDEGGNCSKC